MNNNFLENWMSLKWFSLNQLLSYEWANHEIIYIISLLPIAYLITKYLNKKITYQVSIPKNKLINIRYSLMRFIPNLLFTISIVLIILSLARPQKSNEKVDRWSEGIDIMLVIDISESMQIEDFSPNRLESAKNVDVSIETKVKIGMGESLVRLSIGIEDSNDLINDIRQALEKV